MPMAGRLWLEMMRRRGAKIPSVADLLKSGSDDPKPPDARDQRQAQVISGRLCGCASPSFYKHTFNFCLFIR